MRPLTKRKCQGKNTNVFRREAPQAAGSQVKDQRRRRDFWVKVTTSWTRGRGQDSENERRSTQLDLDSRIWECFLIFKSGVSGVGVGEEAEVQSEGGG